MSDAVAKTPTLDEQMAEFKGFTSVDGAIRPETDDERGAAPEARTTPAPKATGSAQDRLKAALGGGKKAAAATDDGDDGAGEGEGDDESGEGEGQQQQQQTQPKNDPQKRINQAVKRQRAAERERDAARAEMRSMGERLARLEGVVSTGRTAPLTQTQDDGNNNDVAPNPAKYEYGDLDTRYIADLARFEARKAFRAEQEQSQRQSRQRQDSEANAAKVESLRSFAAKGSERYDDFDDVVIASAQANEWPMTPTIGELVLGSEHGPDIAYFLASHKDEAHRVAKLTPAKQAAWFGQQEALLSSQSADASTPKVPQTTKAPPLPSARARGGGSKTSVSADTQDFAAFEAMATGSKH